ncbi:MAG: hypothetical protein AAGI71_01085 [Bacteroidota bacterium]
MPLRAFLTALALFMGAPAFAQEYRPAYEETNGALESGSEIVLVYFGMTSCGPCHSPEFKTALEKAKLALKARADKEGRSFATIGVALDWDVAKGFAFLQEAGAFDEIAVGRNWENGAALTHLWRPEGLETRSAAVPAVVVFEREVSVGASIVASDPVYLFEAMGVSALTDWLEAGAPLD